MGKAGQRKCILAYENYKDIRGISPADRRSIASRKERLRKKANG